MRQFWFILALALGKTVKQLQREMDVQELREWLAFYQIHPWGEVRADMRMARLAATSVNLWTPKDAQPVNEDEFMLRFGTEDYGFDDDEALDLAIQQQQMMYMMAAEALGGSIVDGP